MSGPTILISLLALLAIAAAVAVLVSLIEQRKKNPVPPPEPPPKVEDQIDWEAYKRAIDAANDTPDEQFIQRDFNADDVDDLAIAHVVALYKAGKYDLAVEALQLAIKQKATSNAG